MYTYESAEFVWIFRNFLDLAEKPWWDLATVQRWRVGGELDSQESHADGRGKCRKVKSPHAEPATRSLECLISWITVCGCVCTSQWSDSVTQTLEKGILSQRTERKYSCSILRQKLTINTVDIKLQTIWSENNCQIVVKRVWRLESSDCYRLNIVKQRRNSGRIWSRFFSYTYVKNTNVVAYLVNMKNKSSSSQNAVAVLVFVLWGWYSGRIQQDIWYHRYPATPNGQPI